MTIFFIVIHSIVCIFLALIILMQSGRGGGLTEQFSGAESMFGVKTNSMLVKVTTVFAVIYFAGALTLAYLSSQNKQSLMFKTTSKNPLNTSMDPFMNITIPIDSKDLPVNQGDPLLNAVK